MRQINRFLGVLAAAALLCALLPLGAAAAQPVREATILFTHDLHSCFFPRSQESGELGGFARLSAALAQERTEYPEALVVDGGDFSSGSLLQTLSASQAPELRALGAMGYDAVTAGNHEFDNGPQGFCQMLAAARRGGEPLPALVMANYRPAEDAADRLDLQREMASYGVREYLLLDRGGVTYGIFGLMGESAHESAPASGFALEDPARAAQRCVERLEEQGADVIVCLSHSGTSETGTSEDEDLARAVEGIDLIVSGHTHTTLEEPLAVGDTYIVSAGSHCENLGRVTLSWNEAGEKTVADYRLIPIDGAAGEDPNLSAMAETWKEQVDIGYLAPYGLTCDEILTRSDFFLPLPEAGVQEGSALGELTADAFLWAAERLGGLDAPAAALTASGVLRAPLPKGDLTTSQVFEVLCVGSGADGSAGSPLVSCYLTGKELRAALEVDASIAPVMPDAQLYFSGIEYGFNTHRMFLNKVTDARLTQTGEKPESERLYCVVTSLYCGQMLSAVEERSFGLLSIVPKDENGEPITDLESRILRDSAGHELKEWYALAAYLQSFGEDGIPTSRAWPDGRKDVSQSWNPIELVKSPSLLTVGALLLAALLIAAAALLARGLVRRRRNSRYGGCRRRRLFRK